MSVKTPNPIDKHVGGRVRMRRLMLDMSQEKLGGALGLTFQQVQKYEKGVNRIGAGRLQQLAVILGVPVAFFFEGATTSAAPSSRAHSEGLTPAQLDEFLTTSEGLALIKAFLQIEDSDIRRCIVNLSTELATRVMRH
jgi:transcriptional regulator with XRE-family HTH domain